MRAVVLALRAAVLLCAGAGMALLLWVVARRIAYPYDLEWMEGGMLCHALRLLHRQHIYVAPSVDFIPHLYTPLYPALVAAFAWLLGDVSYLLGRAISALSFFLALVVGGFLVFRQGRAPVAVAVAAAVALPVLAFPLVGGWYDLARCDSLQLFLTVLGVAVAWHGQDSHLRMAAAALLLVLAFLTKQTAAPMIVFVGTALLFTRRPAVLTLALCGVLLFGLSVYLIDRASGGWFWTYVFRLHQGHRFYSHRAYVETPLSLLRILGPALLVVPIALVRGGRDPGLLFLCWLGLGGLLTACVTFGTQWAHINNYIPGVFFPALAIGGAAAHLLSQEKSAPLQAGTLALLLSSLVPLLFSFGPSAHVPGPGDRAAGDAVIARLRAAPGEVLVPFHPFYAHLAGKRTFLHRMGIWDVRDTIAGPVRDLLESLSRQRFSLIVFDDKVEGSWSDWPGVLQHYQIAERFRGPRVPEGAQTVPSLVLLPIPPIDRELQ